MTPRDRVDQAVDRVEQAVEVMSDKMAEVKPKLRGWLHAGTAPLALAAGIVLVALSPTASTRIGSAGVRAVGAPRLHRLGDLPPRHLVAAHVGVPAPLRPRQHLRADRRHLHAVRPALPDGTAAHDAAADRVGRRRSPACSSGSSGSTRRAGSTRRCTSRSAGRRSSSSRSSSTAPTSSAAASPSPRSCSSRSAASSTRSAASSTASSGPNPSPQWFGFHEVFHSFTVLAFAAHYVGVSLATYSLPRPYLTVRIPFAA